MKKVVTICDNCGVVPKSSKEMRVIKGNDICESCVHAIVSSNLKGKSKDASGSNMCDLCGKSFTVRGLAYHKSTIHKIRDEKYKEHRKAYLRWRKKLKKDKQEVPVTSPESVVVLPQPDFKTF